MSSISGLGLSGPVNLLLAFVVVLAVIGVIAWAIRRFTKERLGTAARTRQPRLAVIDTATVDARRQLVIIRRDNVEHLLMIGGASDVVIETNIVRASAAAAGRDTGARTLSVLDASRTSPVYEGTSWPAPQPETNVRLQRSYPLEETAQWPVAVQPEPTLGMDSSPGIAEPGGRQPPARPEPPLRTARLGQHPRTYPGGSRDQAIQAEPATAPLGVPQPERPVPPIASDTPSAATPPSEPQLPAEPSVPPVNVAVRLGSRMDAPLRPQTPPEVRPGGPPFPRAPVQPGASKPEPPGPLSASRENAPSVAPDVEARPAGGSRFSFPSLKQDRAPPVRTAPPSLKVDRPGAPPAGAPMREAPKPKSKSLYESLEQEMASLLGKPPEKS
jgi:hypothetical protein